MKTIRKVNNTFFGISLCLALLVIVEIKIWILVGLSAIPLGLVQLILSIIVAVKYGLKKSLLLYFFLVGFYFILVIYLGWIMNHYLGKYEKIMMILSIGIPILLSIYLTILFYISYKNNINQQTVRDQKINDLNVLDQF